MEMVAYRKFRTEGDDIDPTYPAEILKLEQTKLKENLDPELFDIIMCGDRPIVDGKVLPYT